MSIDTVIDKILSDAKSQANEIVSSAERKADELLDVAKLKAKTDTEKYKKDTESKVLSDAERKDATIRLDRQKILLSYKRKALDAVYKLALNKLVSLKKEDCLKLTERLLREYAEEGDEVLFSENYLYKDDAILLPILSEKGLKVSKEKAKIDGGLFLRGKVSDKDLSYSKLLEQDKEEYQQEIAKELFK